MSRFDQCTETCTTDCGHCKGRPVEALRTDNERLARRLAGRFEETEKLRAELAREVDKALDLTESAQRIVAQSIRQRDEARAEVDRLQSLADMLGANVDALEVEVTQLTAERDEARRAHGAATGTAQVWEAAYSRQEPVIEAAKAYVGEFRWMLESLRQIADRGHDNTVRVALLDAVDALETGDEHVVSAPLIGADATKIPQLSPGTIVRIPGPDVDYVVDKGLETSGAKATLTFTTVDGLDWAEPRAAVQPTGDSQ